LVCSIFLSVSNQRSFTSYLYRSRFSSFRFAGGERTAFAILLATFALFKIILFDNETFSLNKELFIWLQRYNLFVICHYLCRYWNNASGIIK